MEGPVKKRKQKKSKTSETNLVNATLFAKKYSEFGIRKNEKGCLICVYCNNTKISSALERDVKQHIFGSRTKQEKKQTKHQKKQQQAKDQKLIDADNAELRRIAQEQLDRERKRAAGIVDDDVLDDRTKVLEVLWATGIPLTRLNKPRFVSLIENQHSFVGGRQGAMKQQPVLKKMMMSKMKTMLSGRLVALVPDGSKVNMNVEGLLARFLDDDDDPCSLCIGVHKVPNGLNADTMLVLLQQDIVELGLEVENIVAFSSDSGSPNGACFEKFNKNARDLGMEDTLLKKQVLWLPCLMHAMSNVGKVVKKHFVTLKNFMSGYKGMVNTSTAARELFKSVCGKPCPGLADKSFWRWYQCMNSLVEVFGNISKFVTNAKRRELSKKNIAKMEMAMLDKSLYPQMRFVKVFCKFFHDAGFTLEGDGFCAPYARGFLSSIDELLDGFSRLRTGHADIVTICRDEVQHRRMNEVEAKELAADLFGAYEAASRQYQTAVVEKMKKPLEFYQHASIFHPKRLTYKWSQVLEEQQATVRRGILDYLSNLKGLKDDEQLRENLESEWLELIRESREKALQWNEDMDLPSHLWTWWKGLKGKLPYFYRVAKVLVLMQPSSALIERFFSLVKAYTDATQSNEDIANFETRCMVIYNEN
jgi:hypothetical protein